MPAILFVCIHNACRSRIAEAIAREEAPAGWTIASCGIMPSRSWDPKAEEVLRSHGLSIGRAAPRGVMRLPRRRWDFVVGIGCGDLGGCLRGRRFADWLIADPANAPLPVYEALYGELERRVIRLIERLKEEAGASGRPHPRSGSGRGQRRRAFPRGL